MLQLFQHWWSWRWRRWHHLAIRHLLHDWLDLSGAGLAPIPSLARIIGNWCRHAARWRPNRWLIYRRRKQSEQLRLGGRSLLLWHVYRLGLRGLLNILCRDARHIWHCLANPDVRVTL